MDAFGPVKEMNEEAQLANLEDQLTKVNEAKRDLPGMTHELMTAHAHPWARFTQFTNFVFNVDDPPQISFCLPLSDQLLKFESKWEDIANVAWKLSGFEEKEVPNPVVYRNKP